MAPGALTRERDVREAYAAHSRELYGFGVPVDVAERVSEAVGDLGGRITVRIVILPSSEVAVTAR